MFNIENIKGNWPDKNKDVIVLTACDRDYYHMFFQRWFDGFYKWPVSLHIHLIDVPSTDFPKQFENITFTHESTVDWDWTNMKRRYDKHDITQWKKYKATYEWYCQSIRYYLLHRVLKSSRSVIVTDVDAVALRTPSQAEFDQLTSKTQFNLHKNRLYANFCNINQQDLSRTVELAKEIKRGCLIGSSDGNDQVALKKVFSNPVSMAECWTDQEDINNEELLKKKMEKIVFHAKGSRGKNFKLPIS